MKSASPSPRHEPRADEPNAPIEPVDDNRQAMVESLRLMANKGWIPERKIMVLHDYLMARQLYTDFNNFIRKLR